MFVIQGKQFDIPNDQSIEKPPPHEEHTNFDSAIQHWHDMDENVELRRFSRTRKPTISDDYYLYLLECDFDVGPKDDSISFSHVMCGENLKF